MAGTYNLYVYPPSLTGQVLLLQCLPAYFLTRYSSMINVPWETGHIMTAELTNITRPGHQLWAKISVSLPVPGPPHHPLRNKTRTFIL